jgi:Tfp pilus assembly protein PilV
MPSQRSSGNRHGVAFLVETLVLIVVLTSTLAVFAKLVATSQRDARTSARTASAIVLATNMAEDFSASPFEGTHTESGPDVVATCAATSEPAGPGTMFRATITVADAESEATLCTLETARYVGGEA